MPPLRILIADRQEVVRYGLRSLLATRPEWKVVAETPTLRDTVREIQRAEPNVVLFGFPDECGLEAVLEVSKRTPPVAFVVYSDENSSSSIQHAVDLGIQGYVLKSEPIELLEAAIETVAARKKFWSPQVAENLLHSFVESRERARSCRLSARQLQVTRLLAQGKSNKEIAAILGIKLRTVESHRHQLMRRLNVHSITELVYYALRKGIVSV